MEVRNRFALPVFIKDVVTHMCKVITHPTNHTFAVYLLLLLFHFNRAILKQYNTSCQKAQSKPLKENISYQSLRQNR